MSNLTSMFTSAFRGSSARKAVLASAAALALGAATASPALAGDRYGGGRYEGRYDRHDGRGGKHTHVDVDIRIGGHDRRGPEHCEPRYEERQVRVWVPPVYRTVTDRKWCPPVYRTECERVWVPDRWEYREVRHRDRYGRLVVCQERVLVCAGHYETRDRQVCVSDGRWETCERQELVCEGRWEYRTERVRVADAEVEPWRVVAGGLGISIGR